MSSPKTLNNGSYEPVFEKLQIESQRTDGYWIEYLNENNPNRASLVAYGMATGDIGVYQNSESNRNEWKKRIIKKYPGPVPTAQADITGNGHLDLIIAYQYGRTMTDCDPEGGKIEWLENPGNDEEGEWKSYYVGRSIAMHRLAVGHFTTTKKWQILGLPIVSKPFDESFSSPVPVILYTQPDNLYEAKEWPYEVINHTFYHIIHDYYRFKYHSQLDSVLVASREGISWLSYDQNSEKWNIELIGSGKPNDHKIVFYGSAGVSVGRIGKDSLAYIATIEPFHGNTVSVYLKSSKKCLSNVHWTRHVLDVYGEPNQNGEGTAHHVTCADFDHDGDDEFLVALRGPEPYRGVYYYKLVDYSKALFVKWKVSDESAARIAVGDFDGDGVLDFATISYHVAGYYEDKSPSVNVFYNKFIQPRKN